MRSAVPTSRGQRAPSAIHALRRAVLATSRLSERSKDNALGAMRWLPPQHALFTCEDRFKLLRTGNQLGKTTAGLAECIWRCLGEHPYQDVPKGPVQGWILCASWAQSLSIQAKLWALVPKWAVAKGQKFDPGVGFGGHIPVLRFANGSLLFVKTTKQHAIDLSGATIDFAMFDEPPRSQRVFEEVKKRVQARNGVIFMTLTPINARIDWLKKECEEFKIRDLHFRMEPQNLIPVGGRSPMQLPDGTVCDAAWIESTIKNTLSFEVPVTIHGEWEMRTEGRIFKKYRAAGEDPHYTDVVPDAFDEFVMGIDHGHATGHEYAVLVGIIRDPRFPRVVALNEYVSKGDTTPDQDADGILDMLTASGLSWGDLKYVHGDRVTDGSRAVGRKGNRDIEDALAHRLRLKRRDRLKPRIWTAKRGVGRGGGAPAIGYTWLHRQMVRPGHLAVTSACPTLNESFSNFDGADDSKFKHAMDAFRYALDPWILGRERFQGGSLYVR